MSPPLKTTPSPEDWARHARQMLQGYRQTALLYVAAKFGLADQLQQGPRTAEDLAKSIGARPDPLFRVLRGLALIGVVEELAGGLFRLTPLGFTLCRQAPGSIRDEAILCGEEYMAAWAGLAHSVRDGGTAFDRVFGMSVWEHRAANPALGGNFQNYLQQGTRRLGEAVAKLVDFGPFERVADIGGGRGALLATVLRAHPRCRGMVFDQPQVAEESRALLASAGLADRAEFVAGDLFKPFGFKVDALLLKNVLHDWGDANCRNILTHCREAMNGPAARLFVIERELPERATQAPAAIIMDLSMLAITGGRERTRSALLGLAMQAGLRPQSMRMTPLGPVIHEFAVA